MHKVLYELQDLIVDQVADVVNRKDLNTETLHNLDKAIDIYKDVQIIEAMEEEGASYGNMERHDMGYAQANRRTRPRNRGYYDNDDKQRMREHYEKELRRATSEPERESIRRMIMELDRNM